MGFSGLKRGLRRVGQMRLIVALVLVLLVGGVVPLCSQEGGQNPKPVLYIGTSHLDSQWNWTIQDTIRQFVPSDVFRQFRLSAIASAFSAAGRGRDAGHSEEVGLRAQEICWRAGRRVLDCPASNRILAAGQHRGSTSAIRTALNALVVN
jgi:hypothetical protein